MLLDQHSPEHSADSTSRDHTVQEPGQRFAVAPIEVATQILTRDNEVTVCWVPTHHEVPGNKKAEEFAKAAADGSYPDDAVLDEYRWETSLSHMTRVATEARSRSAAEWMRDRFGTPARKCPTLRGRA